MFNTKLFNTNVNSKENGLVFFMPQMISLFLKGTNVRPLYINKTANNKLPNHL